MKGIVWSTKRPLPAFPFFKCPTVPCGLVAQLCYSVFLLLRYDVLPLSRSSVVRFFAQSAYLLCPLISYPVITQYHCVAIALVRTSHPRKLKLVHKVDHNAALRIGQTLVLSVFTQYARNQTQTVKLSRGSLLDLEIKVCYRESSDTNIGSSLMVFPAGHFPEY